MVETKNPFVQIGSSVGGIAFVTILMISLFVHEQVFLTIGSVAWAFAALGLGLAYFASKKK